MNRARTDISNGPVIDGPLWLGMARGIAGFFGIVCLLDAFRANVTGQQTSDFGWLDLTPCPPEGARGLLAFVGVALLLFACTHRLPRLVRPSVIVAVMSLVAVAIGNTVSIHRSVNRGELADGIPMPAHLVALLLPVVFGVIRGHAHGPLRFPVGGFVAVMAMGATAFAFSMGYLSSVSKFHRPRPSDAIVVLPLISPAASSEQQVNAVTRLLQSGCSDRVILLSHPDSEFPALTTGDLKPFVAGAELEAVTVSSDRELIQVLQSSQPPAITFVGDARQSARIRLVAQQLGGPVAFVRSSASRLDESALTEARDLWLTWLAPLTGSFPEESPRELTESARSQPPH